jgi:hypothetical protein
MSLTLAHFGHAVPVAKNGQREDATRRLIEGRQLEGYMRDERGFREATHRLDPRHVRCSVDSGNGL